MNKWLQMLCGILVSLLIIALLGLGFTLQNTIISFVGGFLLGILSIRWIQLEYPEKK